LVVLNKIKIAYLITAFSFFVSCKKEKIGPQYNLDGALAGYTINILNEGSFGNSNASITQYNPITKETAQGVFQSKNGNTLGDVLQSANYHDGKNYLVINNSGKIVIVDSVTFSFESEITGFNSPRYITFYKNKAFVSDLYAKGIYVVNIETNQITGFIPTTGWTERMVIYNDQLFVLDLGVREPPSYLNQGNNKLYKIDPNTNAKLDSVITPLEPNGLVLDQNNKLWMLCSGAVDNQETPRLIRVDPTTLSIEKQLLFNQLEMSPTNLTLGSDGLSLLYINQGVFEFSINDSQLPSVPLISSSETIYGLGVDMLRNEIYVTFSPSFTTNGTCKRYYANGNVIDEFSTGIGPSFIQF